MVDSLIQIEPWLIAVLIGFLILGGMLAIKQKENRMLWLIADLLWLFVGLITAYGLYMKMFDAADVAQNQSKQWELLNQRQQLNYPIWQQDKYCGLVGNRSSLKLQNQNVVESCRWLYLVSREVNSVKFDNIQADRLLKIKPTCSSVKSSYLDLCNGIDELQKKIQDYSENYYKNRGKLEPNSYAKLGSNLALYLCLMLFWAAAFAFRFGKTFSELWIEKAKKTMQPKYGGSM